MISHNEFTSDASFVYTEGIFPWKSILYNGRRAVLRKFMRILCARSGCLQFVLHGVDSRGALIHMGKSAGYGRKHARVCYFKTARSFHCRVTQSKLNGVARM